MERYVQGIQGDIDLLALWDKMAHDGSFRRFPLPFAAPATFVATMQAPTVAFYEKDDQGVWCWFWLEPTNWPVAVGSFWIREDRRNIGAMEGVHLAISAFFQHCSVLLAYTNSEKHVSTFLRFGCTVIARWPGVAAGDDLYLLSLTEDEYKGAQH